MDIQIVLTDNLYRQTNCIDRQIVSTDILYRQTYCIDRQHYTEIQTENAEQRNYNRHAN